ncbi:Cysteine desulfurase [hydrothermal vent metagenome]|uniref:Cysteine desulfurase n=1 Tax=hydrothermal vent metagenome TaxID=652676 RepID=A0A3B0T1C7_9ZZZZ
MLGGSQENNKRASTQNVAGIVGLSKALVLAQKKLELEMDLQTKLRNRLLTEIPKIIDGVHINGHLEKRLPNNAHFSFEKVDGESLLMSLDMEGFAASMGSACSAGSMSISHVLKAIDLDEDLARGSLRVTIGRWTTSEHIDLLLEKLPGIIKSLRI